MRGDRPLLLPAARGVPQFTPHARGSTVVLVSPGFPLRVYPACAGIDLFEKKVDFSSGRLPRMRGDRPRLRTISNRTQKFTPHARGSTVLSRRRLVGMLVYPACAGIDLFRYALRVACVGLPRMRGDRPERVIPIRRRSVFTPHARGSTSAGSASYLPMQVYPACAGIDQRSAKVVAGFSGLPRMRGDRPLPLSHFP